MGLEAGGCCGPSVCSPKFAISTRATRRSRCWSEPAPIWRTTNKPFDLALTITRAGNLFTTHTPVEAGFDRFAPGLMEWYFKKYAEEELSIPFRISWRWGGETRQDSSEPFNMAYLALRGSGAVNGVSQLHGQVSRRIFQSLFPRWPEIEVPVTYVTNGVHTPTWDSAEADRLWEAACGKERWRETMATWRGMFAAPERLRSLAASNRWPQSSRGLRPQTARPADSGPRRFFARNCAQAAQILDSDTLTLGFARRFASYKRPNLLLHDPQRLREHPDESGASRAARACWESASSGPRRPGDDSAMDRVFSPPRSTIASRFPELTTTCSWQSNSFRA